jgi:hypothetical protein
MARAIYATRDAATMLNVSQATLRDWAHKAGIHTQDDPADQRVRGWTLGELQHLASAHHRMLGKPPIEPEPSRRMRELEHEVELLKERVARLEGRQGGVPSSSTTRPLARQIATTARHTGKLPKMPPGAVSFRALTYGEYGVDQRDASKWLLGGELPAPTTEGGPWYGGAKTDRIYLAEQIPAARAALERLTRRAEA